MKKIVALRGKGNTGKTTTIKILHELLRNAGYTIVMSTFKPKGDFIAVFEKNGKKIGITSSGDTYKLVSEKLQELIGLNCDLIICACRSFDRVQPGTNAAIVENSGYIHEFVEKTVDKSTTQMNTNEYDAKKLFDIIKSYITLKTPSPKTTNSQPQP